MVNKVGDTEITAPNGFDGTISDGDKYAEILAIIDLKDAINRLTARLSK